MNQLREAYGEGQLMFLHTLLETHAVIAGDVAEIGDGTWAIHGVIPVDGEVIMAEFTTYDQARTVLDQLPGQQLSFETGPIGPVSRDRTA